MKKATLVIAAYKADLGWIDKIDNDDLDIIIINKGIHSSHPKAKCISVENIGVIDHSVIYYISNFYNELSEYTIFCQDYPFDHYSRMIEFLNNKDYEKSFMPLADKSIHIPCGEGTTNFIENMFDIQFNGIDFPCGAQYSVPKSHIQNRPESFWKDLLTRLPWKTHKFTAYFMERTWMFVYNTEISLNPNYLDTAYFNSVNGRKRLVIANLYRAKNKTSFFAIHQIMKRLSDYYLEFHIVWDDNEYRDEWSDKIDNLDCKIVSYTKEMLNDYCRDYGIPEDRIEKFKKFYNIYYLIHAHYLKKNKITNYYLIYDDDIILTENIDEFKACLENEIPCLISEPMNSNCDKVLANTLFSLYENSFEYYREINPSFLGFNAGIQAMSLDIYEDFIDPKYFLFLLDLFNYNGIYDAEGKEITGPERSTIDTQQQSFFGIMNIIRSKTKPTILDPKDYFICPNWGTHPTYGYIDHTNEYEGWDTNMKSKIIHFIGHTVFNGVYYGKAKVFNQYVDNYLKENNLI
tara:strand:- start:11004 stop:12557 length:1554 start_codon:yes stop_codon:yes gene_type:complete